MSTKIITFRQTCSACPIQYEGEGENGAPYIYFRERWDHWEINAWGDGEPRNLIFGGDLFNEGGKGPLSIAEAEAIIKRVCEKNGFEARIEGNR